MVWAYAELRRLFDYAIIGGVKIEQLPMVG
jgi:hypothetical protein